MLKKSLPPKLWSCFDHYGHPWFALLLVILLHILPATTGQTIGPEVDPDNNKSVATIMGIVALMFLLSGFLSLYSGKCIDRNSRGARFDLGNLPTTTGRTGSRSQTGPRSNGLNQEVIDTFPTFLYSNVKGLKIGKGTLACAVCLNEFEDDETLRLIPKCSHVYHHGCIDAWLASHSTCPVCRANLLVSSQNDDSTMSPALTVVPIQLASESTQRLEHQVNQNEEESYVVDTGEEHNRQDGADVESPKVDFLRRCRTVDSYYQSRTTRSNSVDGRDSVLVQPGENCERFTLRLPDEVRNQMMNSTLKRAKSCVSFTRMSSGTWGYRTRSIVGCGLGLGRGHVQHERFGSEEQSGFVRNGWNNNNNNNRSGRKSSPPVVRCLGVALDHNNVGERSSDSLLPLRIA